MTDALSALTTEERALVVAAVLRDGPSAERILLHGPNGPRLAEISRQLADMPAPERARRVAAEAARLFRALPAGLEHIHPSWIDAALAGEPADAARAVRSGEGRAAVWLRKRLLGHLVAMPEGPPSRPLELADVPRLEPQRLQRLLVALGEGDLTKGARRFAGRGDLLRQIAQRLPVELGRPLLDLAPQARDPHLLARVRDIVESDS